MNKTYIGLVGEKGSGKETFCIFLQAIAKDEQAPFSGSKKIFHIRFSDILKQTLMLWDLPITRHNLQLLAQVMDNGFGQGTLSHAISEQIIGSEADIIILDGIRWQTDLDLLNSFPNPLLVYITADLEKRYNRLLLRGEKSEEHLSTLEQFKREEMAKNELLIPKFGKRANVKIENNGILEDFKVEVEKFYVKYLSDGSPTRRALGDDK